MEIDIKRFVDEVTGLKATTFLSDHDVEQDVAIEVVLLAPRDQRAA